MTTHIEDFAHRLRELKERSGRSYGTLAARLHTSTSTLHRYCNGAAVPSEYAPVERFARQCGATPEELLALHRLWLLADAARRREPDRPSSASPSSTAVAPPPPDASDAQEARDAPPAGVAQAQVPETGGPSTDAPAQEGPAIRGGLRPRRPRRTKAVLGAVAAIALASPLAIHAGLGSQAARASAPVASPPPVQVSVLSDNWDVQCGQWFLLAQSPGKVPSPPSSLQQTNAWAGALGGISAGDLRLQVTAQGLPGQPVVLHALYVRIVSSNPAPSGNGYTPASGCGGGLEPASFAVNLDAPVPRAQSVPSIVAYGEKASVSNFPFVISASDPQVLDVDAHTSDHDVSWYLELVWSCGNRMGTLRVDDHGKPFRTVGLKGDPTYFYDGTGWAPAQPQS
jgi:plasmid maintenance system antidote protein VapI